MHYRMFGHFACIYRSTTLLMFRLLLRRYQMDGYFNGGTAPWLQNDLKRSGKKVKIPKAPALEKRGPTEKPHGAEDRPAAGALLPSNPACVWSAVMKNSYLAGCAQQVLVHRCIYIYAYIYMCIYEEIWMQIDIGCVDRYTLNFLCVHVHTYTCTSLPIHSAVRFRRCRGHRLPAIPTERARE